MSTSRTTVTLAIVSVVFACATEHVAGQVAVDNGGPNAPAFAVGRGGGGVGGGGGSAAPQPGWRLGRRRTPGADESRRLRREAMLARREIERAFVELKRQFLDSGEYRDALADITLAAARLRATREASLAPLRETTKYRTSQLQITKLEAQIDAMRELRELREQRPDDTAPSTIASLARALLDERGRLSKLEADALREDDAYADARYALIDARGRLSALWKEFEDSVRHDARSIAARERLASVRRQLTG